MTNPNAADGVKPRSRRPATLTASRRDGDQRRWISREQLWIHVLLIAATVAVYAQVNRFDFVSYDDSVDVYNNRHVREGITFQGIGWALTSGEDCNWMPLTRISHMLDVQVFGMQAGWHHVSNLVFHVLATLLLFLFLNRATGARWRSAFVALLFALHPLHVESAAWIAERKDVLCAFLWFLTLCAYVQYAERGDSRAYRFTLLFFCLALMAKPMAVTLPFVLLLLDFWPLCRLTAPLALPEKHLPRAAARINWRQALREKLPFFALSTLACLITYSAQSSGGAVRAFTSFPTSLRIENVAITYLTYIYKMFLPGDLAVFYPYPHDIPIWQAGGAAVASLCLSLIALRTLRTYPYFAFGWFWYLGTLIPVIGFIQIGDQARADRYMYIPMAGLLIAIAWGAADVLKRWPRAKVAIAALAVTACASAAAVTSFQLRYWRNTPALFEHALDVTSDNYLAHTSLGTYLLDVPGQLPQATSHLETAVQISSNFAEAHNNLGMALLRSPGRFTEAVSQLDAALRLRPNYADAHNNMASALLRMPGRLPEAVSHYEAALRLAPDSAEIHYNLGVALSYMPGRVTEAVNHFETSLRISPDSDTHYNLAMALLKLPGRAPEAVTHLEAALRINPGYEPARQLLNQLQSAHK
jgi:protein O-mannosyl-transferase